MSLLILAVELLITLFTKIVTYLAKEVTKAFDSIGAAINKVVDFVSNLIDKFKQAFEWAGKVFSASAVAGPEGKGLIGSLISNISGRASGGPVNSNTPYIVGEQGPELFVPRNSGSIIPNGVMGGVSVNVVVNGDVSGRDLVEKVQDAIMSNLRTTTRFSL